MVALRVLVWIQIGFLALGILAAVVLVGFSSFGLGSRDDLTRGFAGLGVIAGVVLGGVGAVLLTMLLVPVLLLRSGRRARKTGALITLAVFEGLFVAVQLAGAVASLTGRRPAEGVFPLLLAVLPAVVLVLALQPASRAWAARHPDDPAAWGPPPPTPHPPPSW